MFAREPEFSDHGCSLVKVLGALEAYSLLERGLLEKGLLGDGLFVQLQCPFAQVLSLDAVVEEACP